MLRWLGMGVVALAAALGAGSKYAKRELPLHPVGTGVYVYLCVSMCIWWCVGLVCWCVG